MTKWRNYFPKYYVLDALSDANNNYCVVFCLTLDDV